jgi:hypothetical protein
MIDTNPERTSVPRPRKTRQWAAVLTCVAAMIPGLGIEAKTPIVNPQDRLCYNRSVYSTIDGDIRGDVWGWQNAFRYWHDNGTDTPDATVQGGRYGTNIRMSFEVRDDKALHEADVIVLGFQPNSGVADYRGLFIYPAGDGSIDPANNPRKVEYLTATTLTNGHPNWVFPAGALPAGTVIKVSAAPGTSSVDWFVEASLPAAGFGLSTAPGAADFKHYFNVIVSDGTYAREHAWPTDATPMYNAVYQLPDPAEWGNATLTAATCHGVSIATSDITTNNTHSTLDARINPNGVNYFYANVHNNTVNAAGTYVPVSDVIATFKWGNFGIPATLDWKKIPVPGANPPPALSITANSSATATIGPWDVSTDPNRAYYMANPYWCVLVELSTTNNNTFFTNYAAHANMYFGTSSSFRHEAVIGTRGYPAPQGRDSTQQLFRLFVTTRADVPPRLDSLRRTFPDTVGVRPDTMAPRMARRDTTRNRAITLDSLKLYDPLLLADTLQVPKDKVLSRYRYLVRACRVQGGYIDIEGKRLLLCDPVGAYGYILRHIGNTPVKNWTASLAGKGLTPVERDSNAYELRIAVDSAGSLSFSAASAEAGGGGSDRGCMNRLAGPMQLASLLGGVGLIGLIGVRRRRRGTDVGEHKQDPFA